ncbi:SpaA isopeptide-forming pilin-related protein, partial [uncultured Parvimonas sp.]|uniref:SpaA isopeptide-forming pilin-related protein n=1 Tax=uncultured Parvimonas sp. TaxID=747372 RepID=UPI0025932027
MKKAKSILAFLVSIGMIMPNLSQVYAQESNDYGVVGAYEAYSIAENLYEQGKKVKTGNEMIRIRKNPKGGSKEVGEIAYCFNADRAVPDIQGATPDFTGEDYPEDTLITYTKVAGTASKFSSLAVNARENARNAILKVMYNGFRDGDANRVDEIKNAFKAKYPNKEEGNISDAEIYAATQKAIWYYTDSQELATQKPSEAKIEGDEIDATMNTKTWYVYQFLLGQALTDDNPLKGMTLNEVQGNNTLDLYKPARSHQLHNKGYQNLLSSKFVTSNTETKYSEFDVKIKKIDKDGNSILANARLKLEAVNNGSSDQRLFMWTTKEDGGLNPTTFKLPAGEYLLTELSAPEGYKLAEPITVKVSDTGEVTYNIKNKAETTTPSDKTVVMVNEKTDTMTVNVNKEWKDKNDGIPSGLDFLTTNVKLLADGQPAVDASGNKVPEQLLSKGNQWKASFKNLPIYKNGTNSGEKIVYTVSESEIDGYKLIQGGDTKVSGNVDKDVKAIQLVNKETDTPEPEQTLITKVQVNKKWSNQDKKSSKDIYFELWKVKDGSESVVAPADFASMPKAFQARQKLPSNGTMVIWNKLYLKEQGYTFKVKEVDESGNAWQDKANGYKEGSAKIESNVDKAQQLLVFDVTNNYEEVAKTKVNFSKKALTENGKELAGATIKLTKE